MIQYSCLMWFTAQTVCWDILFDINRKIKKQWARKKSKFFLFCCSWTSFTSHGQTDDIFLCTYIQHINCTYETLEKPLTFWKKFEARKLILHCSHQIGNCINGRTSNYLQVYFVFFQVMAPCIILTLLLYCKLLTFLPWIKIPHKILALG